MSDWIPTAERLPEQQPDRHVLTQEITGEIYVMHVTTVSAASHVAWQELPKLYVPPKPKRRKGTLDGGWNFNWLEVLPGDPDPDVVLEFLEDMRNSNAWLDDVREWVKRIEESRSK